MSKLDKTQKIPRELRLIFKKYKIRAGSFLCVQLFQDKLLICTGQGTIECDYELSNPQRWETSVGRTMGRNETGHKLPASSTGWG